MSLRFVLDESQRLHVSAVGDFDCELAHELLQRARIYWWSGASAAHVDLAEVGQPSDCAVVALLGLSEMFGAGFHLESCSAETEAVFLAGLRGDYSLPQPVERCTACLQGKELRCDKVMSTHADRCHA